MKIGLYFGSFNPIHNGHLICARYVASYKNLDKLLLVVSPNNPFKDDTTLLDARMRVKLAKLATAYDDVIEVCDIELNMPKPSYTINSIKEIKSKYGDDNEYFLIIGIDNIINFDKWKDYQDIVKQTNLLVIPRICEYASSIEDCQKIIERVKDKIECELIDGCPLFTLSSSFIRSEIKKNKNIRFYVTDNVFRAIIDNKLYK